MYAGRNSVQMEVAACIEAHAHVHAHAASNRTQHNQGTPGNPAHTHTQAIAPLGGLRGAVGGGGDYGKRC